MRVVSLVVFTCLALIVTCASCGGGSGQRGLASAGTWGGELPGIAVLDGLEGSGVTRTGSEASLNLLASAPFDQAATGVTYNPGYLYLDSSVEAPSWAIFRIGGLGTEGDAFPLSVNISNSAICWLGVADYSRGTWQFHQVILPGDYTLAGGADLVSEAGNCYIAMLAHDTIPDIYTLTATLNNAPAGAPTAQLNLLGLAVTEWNTSFDATGSAKGGGEFTEFVYEFDGGSQQTVAAADTVVEHMFASTGTHTVKLTVRNDLGLEHFVLQNIEVADPNRDLLVVYNSDIPEDLDLADYYMSPRTGRGIDPQHKLGLALGGYSATITRANYEAQIRAPIEQFITDIPTVGGKIKYLLLMKGLPHQIPGANEFSEDSTFSSVDSELCLMRSVHDIDRYMWNSSVYGGFAPTSDGFYLQSEHPFVALVYTVIWHNSDHTVAYLYNLDYLVGRLSAYTYDEAKLIVDRSLAAGAPGADDWVVFDSCADRDYLDTMVDPVYNGTVTGDASQDSGEELLTAAGINVFADVTSERIVNGSSSLPAGFNNSVIGYAGWGVNHSGGSYAHGSEYILEDLGWAYAPGAVFMSYESFNGTDFDDSDGITRRGQGQVCDFIRMGGTVAIGNAYEPFSVGVGDERFVFDRYLHHGDRWIEAAYKGLRMLSWQEVVVGDPLCQLAQ